MRLSSSPPLIFLFLLGTASAGLVFSRNDDGTFGGPSFVDETNKIRDGVVNIDRDNLLNNLDIPSGEENGLEVITGRSTNSDPRFENADLHHIAKSPLDDDDLNLVQETFTERKINKTGQLRYSSLPLVEKALIKDIVRLILKDEEYMILLNRPSFPDVVKMVRSMLREPTQDVLQQQIWSKVLAVEAYYNKYYKPMTSQETKKQAMDFLTHLKSASEKHELTVDDTVQLEEKMKTLAFLIQEKSFNDRINDLEETITENQDKLTGKPMTSDHNTGAQFKTLRESNENSNTTTHTPATTTSTAAPLKTIHTKSFVHSAPDNTTDDKPNPAIKNAPGVIGESKNTPAGTNTIIHRSPEALNKTEDGLAVGRLSYSSETNTFNFDY